MFTVLMLLTATAAALNAAEPQCSRFHYEEQTLAKVIKLEILVQKMKEDLDSTQRQVLDKMLELENDKEKMKVELDTEMETIKTEFKQVKEKSEADLSRLTEEVKKTTDAAIKPPTAAFLAKELTNITPKSGEVLVFKTSMLNEGHGYDNTSGIFTAPTEGVYLFTIQLCVSPKSVPQYIIVADDKYLKRGYFYDKENDSCHTADAVAILKPKSRVWVTTSTNQPLQQGGYYWNTFSGVLL
ncbi:complement C1q tumor necrosis factor-related protein 5-like [Mercenaria mercenaria]|uniref:complement C1q tumor necrosis factor-related protein 5-like n=1 Tax=Mercenaria mercenaria TaxID=6596 RepID=UPI00234E4F84|nr:complement C1q tumor necrosis factor-related protein 5-like [Mercenaria mercenaria]